MTGAGEREEGRRDGGEKEEGREERYIILCVQMHVYIHTLQVDSTILYISCLNHKSAPHHVRLTLNMCVHVYLQCVLLQYITCVHGWCWHLFMHIFVSLHPSQDYYVTNM